MLQNADSFADVMGLFGPGPGPETAAAGAAEPAAPAVLDCRTALLAPEDARRLPTWQPPGALLAACRDDPARFQAEVLGRTLWTRQVAVCDSEWHGVLDDARHRLEPVVVELARRWGVPAGQIVYDMAGIGRSFGSYLASYGLPGTTGYFGAGRGGQRYVNRRTANAFALRRRLDPHRDGFIPFYCGGIPEWPNLRQELAELYGPAMEIQESQVKQLLEAKEALSARLHRSPDLLDALLMTFSFLHAG